jgi:hypothetical protein
VPRRFGPWARGLATIVVCIAYQAETSVDAGDSCDFGVRELRTQQSVHSYVDLEADLGGIRLNSARYLVSKVALSSESQELGF